MQWKRELYILAMSSPSDMVRAKFEIAFCAHMKSLRMTFNDHHKHITTIVKEVVSVYHRSP